MNHRSMRVTVLVAAACLTLVAGCGGSDGDGAGTARGGDDNRPAGPQGPAMEAVKAPSRFSPEKSVALPDSAGAGNVSMAGPQQPLPLALHRGRVYITRPDGMEIADGYRKADPVLLTPRHEPLATLDDLGLTVGSNPARRPVIAEHGGKTLALSSLITQMPGSGTTKGHQEVELLAADTSTAAKAWSARIPLGEMEYSMGVEEEDTEVVGVHGDTVILYAQGSLLGVDANTRRKTWKAPGTYAGGAVLVAGKVVALRDEEGGDRYPVGLDPTDGHQRWAVEDLAAESLAKASPDTVIVGGYLTGDDGGAGAVLLKAASSERVETYDGKFDAAACHYDGLATTVCTGADSVVAYNTRNGSARWKLPEGNRVAPEVTLVRSGLVYGTTENGPVVLDSTTGADKEDRPGIAPYATDGYVGVGVADADQTVTAYRVEH